MYGEIPRKIEIQEIAELSWDIVGVDSVTGRLSRSESDQLIGFRTENAQKVKSYYRK